MRETRGDKMQEIKLKSILKILSVAQGAVQPTTDQKFDSLIPTHTADYIKVSLSKILNLKQPLILVTSVWMVKVTG